MKEVAVEAAFVRHLMERGGDVYTDTADHVDFVARRGVEHIVAEVKGTTSSAGLDVDTAYGQLLRRMVDQPEGTRFAMVVPESGRYAALRVPVDIREKLAIDAWVVNDFSTIVQIGT